MLAKQSWRMITHPDTLCKQVLRPKYFRDGNLLRVGPKKGYSYTWQIIVVGLQTFRRGHIWRVGTGEKLNIWEDHWVPGSLTRTVYTRKGNILLRTVDELIDPYTRTWDRSWSEVYSFMWIVREFHWQSSWMRIFVAWHRTKYLCSWFAQHTKWSGNINSVLVWLVQNLQM